jgi:hypothetical protein
MSPVSTGSSDRDEPILVDAAPSSAGNAAYNERIAREAAAENERVAREAAAQSERAASEAYERGRRDERARRKSHPVFWGLVLLLAGAGAIVIAVAVNNGGSFSRGGQVVDQNLAQAAQQARPVVQRAQDRAAQSLTNAADRAGESLDRAGHDVAAQVSGRPAPASPPAAPATPVRPAAPAR